MTKLGIVRCFSECALGSGCIAGGVECAKAKSTIGSFEKENKELKAKNKTINDAGNHYKKEGEVLKEAVSYAATGLHKLATMSGDAKQLKQNAQDAKGGLRNDYLDNKGVSSNFHKGA